MTLTQTLNANTCAQASELAAWPATSHEASELAAWPATSHTAVAPSKKKKKNAKRKETPSGRRRQAEGDAKRNATQRKMCVQAVGPSGGSTVECNTGDGVPMGGMGYGVVTGVDGCAPVSARRTSRSLALLVGAARASRRAAPASPLLRPLTRLPANVREPCAWRAFARRAQAAAGGRRRRRGGRVRFTQTFPLWSLHFVCSQHQPQTLSCPPLC